uniref:Uncharacterized protein n=1 Tax=Panagrolaimus sp. JU765 TaxID=591449 RepID=A0AC34Q6I1_9BILA
MQAINRAMEQLKIKQNLENAKNNSSKTQKSPPQKLREWLQKVEKELERFRSGLTGKMIGGIANLQKMASDHQCFQQQIESEGQLLLTEVKKHYNSRSFQENAERKNRSKRTVDLLEQRLLTSWLKSLENLERISTLLKNLQLLIFQRLVMHN